MRAAAALGVLAACWTGPEEARPVTPAQPVAKPRVAADYKLRRTPCFGHCPSYTVEIAHDGKITWTGDKFVQTLGEAHAEVPASDLRQLARAADLARFFELDDNGHFSSPDSQTVFFCTDTSHAVVTITRAGTAHTVDDGHCENDNPKLLELEQLIDKVAGTRDWIGR
jgi:hypothetical protein